LLFSGGAARTHPSRLEPAAVKQCRVLGLQLLIESYRRAQQIVKNNEQLDSMRT
jgi:hypothetical protein